ncbi:MAG TPA: DUF2490 domain-containing protein [Chitinophagales bacterium]|nr:DUF2490 domain-containing protein [Chitinophagales bacterium]HNI01419.1 DUF2490 domain-containing protein [Chitinophagales bacterium]
MKRIIISILLFVCINTNTFAEKNKLKQASLWFRYKADINLPKKNKIYFEIEDKILIAPSSKHSLFYWRIGAEKQFKSNWSLGGGIYNAYFGSSDLTHQSTMHIPEVRPFINIGYKQNINSFFSIVHRYRTEWRFIKNTDKEFTETIDGFKNYFRFRYQMSLNIIPFKKDDKELSIALFDEVFINAGKKVQKNVFDQNRLGLAVKYNFNKTVATEISYIYNIQQKSNGDDMYNRQILRFTLYTNFNILKKEKQN